MEQITPSGSWTHNLQLMLSRYYIHYKKIDYLRQKIWDGAKNRLNLLFFETVLSNVLLNTIN